MTTQLILPARFYQQPQQLMTIDWSNPITRSLVIALNGASSNINLASGQAIVSSSNVQQSVGDKGIGITYPSVSGSGIKVNSSTVLRGSIGNGSGFTILILANPSASTARMMPFSIGGSSPELYIAFNADAGFGVSSGKFASCLWNYTGTEGIAGAVDGKTHLFGVIHPEGVSSYTPQLYIDGIGPNPEVSTSFYPSSSDFDTIAGYQGGGFSATGYSQFLTLAFNRVLSGSEMKSMADNPWQIFKAPKRRIWATFASSGIAFDAAANSGYQAAASTYTFNRTVTGSNTFLAIDVSLLSAGQTVTSIVDDFGGTAVNAVFVGAQSTVSSVGRVEMWRVLAPVAGTKTIQVNLSGSIASSATAVSYTGVHQSSPTEGFNSAQATNVGAADATVNITTVADNCWVHGAIATNDTAITANQTSRNNVSGAGGSGANEDNNTPKTPAGSVTMSYTGVDALATWAIAGYAIRPVAASGLGGTVFTSSLLNGLSSAGKFFRNPLG